MNVPAAWAQVEVCIGQTVAPGDNLALAVKNGAEGQTFCISGHHRLAAPLVMKAGMTLWGQDGAVLDGSKVLSGHVIRNGRYVFPNQTQNSTKQRGKHCRNYPRNCYNDGLFFDGVALFHVPLEKLGPGKYFFDYVNNRIFLADNPTGHTVELTKAKHLIEGTVSGVTIRDLVLENAATSAILAKGSDWRILNVESRWNHTVGARTNGDNFLVQGGHFHHNGQYGLNGFGAENGAVVGVETDHNDHLRFGFGMTGSGCWHAGEAKWSYSTALTLRDNHVHDGFCHGFWVDINSRNPLVENNRLIGNAGKGLFIEISYGGIVRNNTFSGNGDYDLSVASSSDVEVYANQFIDGAGFRLHQQGKKGSPRSGQCPPWDPSPCQHLAINNWIHDNAVECGSEICAAAVSQGVDGFFENNRIDLNTYLVDALGTLQWRLDTTDVPFESWQARGFDLQGSVVPISP